MARHRNQPVPAPDTTQADNSAIAGLIAEAQTAIDEGAPVVPGEDTAVAHGMDFETLNAQRRSEMTARILSSVDVPQAAKAFRPFVEQHSKELLSVFERQAPVYRWQIDGGNGYFLTLDVNATNLPEARASALAAQIPLGTADGQARPLTPQEAYWVANAEPEMVRDTRDVPLEHIAALEENERLVAENAQYADLKQIVTALGIDLKDPHRYALEVHAEAAATVMAMEMSIKAKESRIDSVLASIIDSIEFARDDNGTRPPAPPEPFKPNGHGLKIFGAVHPETYPELKEAAWVTTEPGQPLTPLQAQGIKRIKQLALDRTYKGDQREVDELRAAMAVIDAEMPVNG